MTGWSTRLRRGSPCGRSEAPLGCPVAIPCWWRLRVGGDSVLVATPCRWRSVGGGSVLVAVPCWWRFRVGGGSVLVAGRVCAISPLVGELDAASGSQAR